MTSTEPNSTSGRTRLTASLPVLLAVSIVGLGMTAGLTANRDSVLPAVIGGHGYAVEARKRLRDAMWHVEPEQQSRISLLFGSSAMSDSILIEDINNSLRPGWQVMGLAGAGRERELITELLRALDVSEFVPGHIVLGVTVSAFIWERPNTGLYLVEKLEGDFTTPTNLRERVNKSFDSVKDLRHRGSYRSAAVFAKLRERLYGHYKDPTVAAPISMSGMDGQNDREIQDPFRAVRHFAKEPDVTGDERIALLESRVEEFHHCIGYTPDKPPTPESCRELGSEITDHVRTWLDRGVPVTILYLPEYSSLRECVPNAWCDIVTEYLTSSTGNSPLLRIHNLRDQLPDTVFSDPMHVAPDSRPQSVELLLPFLGPPPQAATAAQP